MKRLLLLALIATSALVNAARIEIDSAPLHDCRGEVVLHTSCDENQGVRYYQLSIKTENCSRFQIQRNGSRENLSDTKRLMGDQPNFFDNNIQLNSRQADALVNNGLNVYVHSTTFKTADGGKVTVPASYRPETCRRSTRPTPPPSGGEEY